MLSESIINNIKQVPPLPESIMKAEELFAQSNPNMNELIKIIELDPVLTANILAIANSSLYSFSKKILSIRQAVTMFGMSSIRGFILSFISANSFKLDMSPYGISNKEYQDISLLQSTLMFQWFMTIDIEKSGILVPMAFLMDIGKIIIAREISLSGSSEEFKKMLNESKTISEVEKHFTGMTSAEVTALLFNHWNFNELYANVIKDSDEPYYADEEFKVLCQAIDVVKSCINVKECMTEDSFKVSKLKALQYGLSVATFMKTVTRIQTKLAEQD